MTSTLSTLPVRTHLCGYDLNLTYPQDGHFPTISPPLATLLPTIIANTTKPKRQIFNAALKSDSFARLQGPFRGTNELESHPRKAKREAWKRNLAERANGTIDPTYACDLYDEMVDYALNFSMPWST